jgi:4-hydroxy-tetrahydrodipicolinate synthase
MTRPVFTGAAVAIVTPFTDNGVNFGELERLIEFQIKEGIDAIVICGTTGEASTMPDPEHKEVIRFAVEKVKSRVPVIAGTGSNDTRHAIELSRFAQEAGADAILTVTPYYNKATQNGLYMHFKAIAESIDIPVILYNVPSRTVLNIDPSTLQKLSEVRNIAGVKECNLSQTGKVAALCGPDFTIYSGEDGQVLPMLAYGGKGVISVAANIVPADMHYLVESFLNGDIEKSRNIQLKLLPLIDALFSEVNPIPVKAAMKLMGFNAGKCRLPLTEIEPKNLENLKNEMRKYGLLG